MYISVTSCWLYQTEGGAEHQEGMEAEGDALGVTGEWTTLKNDDYR